METKIREIREKLHMKQKELAKLVAISPQTLSGYESGYRQPDLKTLIRIAQILNTSTDNILGIENFITYPNECLTEDENQLMTGYRQLGDKYKEQIKQIIEIYKTLEKKQDKK